MPSFVVFPLRWGKAIQFSESESKDEKIEFKYLTAGGDNSHFSQYSNVALFFLSACYSSALKCVMMDYR